MLRIFEIQRTFLARFINTSEIGAIREINRIPTPTANTNSNKVTPLSKRELRKDALAVSDAATTFTFPALLLSECDVIRDFRSENGEVEFTA
jgi:hypothetical protein